MADRPEVLLKLFSDLTVLNGVGPKTAQHFEHLGVHKPKDLLMTLPASVIDRRPRATVQGATLPDVLTVEAVVEQHIPPRVKGRPYHVAMRDAETAFHLVFFRAHEAFLKRTLPVGERRLISGKAEYFDTLVQIVHPEFILAPEDAGELPEFEPIYPLTSGITQKLMYRATRSALSMVPELAEWIEPELKKRENWPSWHEAIHSAHTPASLDQLTPQDAARQRLAYDEFLAHQLTLSLARAQMRKTPGRRSVGTGALSFKLLETLPYKPTRAQSRAVEEIASDMAGPDRMNRLLQGDVGAGKTLVALLALLIAVESGGQGVLMAPTEILARQHVESLRPLLDGVAVRMEVLTGRDKGQDRRRKLEALASGEIQILVGTHAVFQEDVSFADLRLAIVDEQHRFGVRQRLALGEKGASADVLVMTATPIPRSLALAQYGDMDVSVLDEKPAGRKPIATAMVSTARLDEVVEKLRHAIQEGRQAYWVCPLVEESEVTDKTAAEARFKHLRSELGEGKVGLVHGQMPPAEKDAAMARFVAGELAVLVATTVIEVGVNVPNATIMIIERAEGFGLAQLHQLRGRVGRGDAASTCLLLFQPPLSETASRRLRTLRDTEDGFRISEEDLAMRGAGDLIGTAQSGLPQFRIADLERQAGLMAKAQSDARLLLAQDPSLTGDRGRAARVLLWLTEQDKAIRYLSIG